MLIVSVVLILVFLVIGLPIGFAIGGCSMLGFAAAGFPITNYCTAFFTSMDSFPLMAVPFFIISGNIMEKGGISEKLVNLARLFVGKVYGGLGIITAIACAIFGAVSGSAAATTAAMGGIMFPEMKKEGYEPEYSAALIAVTGVIGALIPPSLAFVLYGSATGVSIGDMFTAGIIPGLLLTGMLGASCYFTAKKEGWKPVAVDHKSAGGTLKVVKESILALLMPVIILGGIYSGQFTPTEAGAMACLYAVIVTMFIYKNVTLKILYEIIRDSAKLCSACLLIAAFCDPLAKVLTLAGIPQALQAAISAIAPTKILFLLLINLVLIVCGMFIDATAGNLLLSPLLLPIAQSYGVDPVHFGIILCMNLTLGLCTPPVGSSLYISASITGVDFGGILKRVWPLLIVSFTCLALVTYIPQLSLAFL